MTPEHKSLFFLGHPVSSKYSAAFDSPEELGPGLYGFLSPEPDPGEDAEEEEHEILDHVDREVWLRHRSRGIGRARNMPFSFVFRVPA